MDWLRAIGVRVSPTGNVPLDPSKALQNLRLAVKQAMQLLLAWPEQHRTPQASIKMMRYIYGTMVVLLKCFIAIMDIRAYKSTPLKPRV